MANAFKNAGAAIGTSRTDVYTCPASTEAVIHAVYLSNIDGTSSVDATIEVYDNSVTTYYHVGKTIPVPADGEHHPPCIVPVASFRCSAGLPDQDVRLDDVFHPHGSFDLLC